MNLHEKTHRGGERTKGIPSTSIIVTKCKILKFKVTQFPTNTMIDTSPLSICTSLKYIKIKLAIVKAENLCDLTKRHLEKDLQVKCQPLEKETSNNPILLINLIILLLNFSKEPKFIVSFTLFPIKTPHVKISINLYIISYQT